MKMTKYEMIESKRLKHVEAILSSQSRKKVVVAGPGTGKTYLFKRILEGKPDSLTLTFINSLVEDLSLELYGMSEVKTLHSFARSILSRFANKQINVYPRLSNVIKDDAEILIEEVVDFDKLFYEREDESKFIEFYRKRRTYYDYYGYIDIIFAAVKYFEENRHKMPTYEQVLVDEFQDFNKLEVSLIDLLAEKSPILLAGDDDQALYEFKSASTRYIRERHSNEMPEFESFNLPYCARCTRVIVEAANDIIESAKKSGFLDGRINKPYIYFDHQEKDKESEKYSKIYHTQKFIKAIPWFIKKQIAAMADDIKSHFTVLIISPYKKQSHAIAETLKEKGLHNIEYAKTNEPEVTLLDGIKLILENKNDNLGWRIASKFLLNDVEFIDLLKKTESYPKKGIHELIDPEYKAELMEIVGILNYINKDKPVTDEKYYEVLQKINLDPFGILKEFLKEEMSSTIVKIGIPALRKIQIKASTIPSSKGLAADLVFITHFDDMFFVKNEDKTQITDQDICNFLVALSRTKKKLYLISCREEKPTFYKWIKPDRFE